MIDYCGQSLLPGVVWCYAVPPEFMDTIVPEYPALAQRLKGSSRFSGVSPMQPIIDLDHLPLGSTEMLAAIGLRLLELSELAYDHAFDRATQERNLRELARQMGELSFESGTRRTFVKAAVSVIQAQRRGEERVLSSEEIRRLAGAEVADGPEPMAGEVEILVRLNAGDRVRSPDVGGGGDPEEVGLEHSPRGVRRRTPPAPAGLRCPSSSSARPPRRPPATA